MKTTRQSGSDRRISLLQAALDLFSTQGYDGTTTKAIAERVGVTEALLFRHFRTKQDLLRAVVTELGPRRQLTVEGEPIQDLPIRPALESALTQYLDAFWENRACLRMMLMESWRDQEAVRELRVQFAEGAYLLGLMLSHRMERGELRPGVVEAATDVVSAAVGGFVLRCLREEPEDWLQARATFLANLMEILFSGVSPCS